MSDWADVSDVTADEVSETFEAARDELMLDPYRDGQVVRLQENAELWVTGDLHDQRTNFSKLLATADLGDNPRRHLLLHELIHGSYFDPNGAEDSWKMLYRAAELKCDFPEQVHFILANHDLAQIFGEGIMKAGLSVCEAYTKGIKNHFGETGGALVESVMTEFFLALPLAVSTPGGTFVCHSLPQDEQIDDFDYTVFKRERLKKPDYQRRTGPAYQLIWGRNMSPATTEKFAENVGANVIITGHQPQDSGFMVNGDKHLIIASDHAQGVLLPIDCGEKYEMADLVSKITRFVAIDPETFGK
ncbi:MAG: metallophosphoesterase [Planctomycetota bacterium]